MHGSFSQAVRQGFEVNGVVKNYDKNKHFGFVTPEDPGFEAEIFIDGRCLEKSGIKDLAEGTRVLCKGSFREGKGPKARRLKVIE